MISRKILTFLTLSFSVILATLINIGFSGNTNLAQGQGDFTTDFRIEECSLKANGANPYYSLEPGYQLAFEGEEDGEELRLLVTVLKKREDVAGVKTRVIEEREWADGELVEVSRNFFARCKETNDIYYFGEDVDIYEDGEIVSHDGAWRAGENGATPGIIMPGTYLLGSRYFQEVAPDVALDRAEHVAMGLDIEVPAGSFSRCVEIVETTPLEPDAQSTKRYCPGVGLVFDDGVELVDFGQRIVDRGDDNGDDGGDEEGDD